MNELTLCFPDLVHLTVVSTDEKSHFVAEKVVTLDLEVPVLIQWIQSEVQSEQSLYIKFTSHYIVNFGLIGQRVRDREDFPINQIMKCLRKRNRVHIKSKRTSTIKMY